MARISLPEAQERVGVTIAHIIKGFVSNNNQIL